MLHTHDLFLFILDKNKWICWSRTGDADINWLWDASVWAPRTPRWVTVDQPTAAMLTLHIRGTHHIHIFELVQKYAYFKLSFLFESFFWEDFLHVRVTVLLLASVQFWQLLRVFCREMTVKSKGENTNTRPSTHKMSGSHFKGAYDTRKLDKHKSKIIQPT